jgi:ABC-type transporter Mla MlaB component
MSFATPSGLYEWMSSPATTTIVCDARGLRADAVAVDALARLQLHARRLGVEIRLRQASSELRELLAFVGLHEVLGVETGGQTEEREERGGVEEERELGDPPAS